MFLVLICLLYGCFSINVSCLLYCMQNEVVLFEPKRFFMANFKEFNYDIKL